LVDLGDGVACLEFHTKANALDDNIYEMMELSLQEVKRNFIGLVIGNEGKHFCAGANIRWILEKSREGNFDEIDRRLRRSQQIRMNMRYFPKPVVAACFGMTLGGGVEIVMASSRVCAAAESRIGLVETGVGLIPGGGGCKELIRRVVSPPTRNSQAEPMVFIKQIFNYISTGKVSNSAYEALEMGFLTISDRVIMNRDQLLTQAKRLVVYLEEAGYIAPTQEKNIYAVGRRGKSVLEHVTYLSREAGQIQEHSVLINEKLAHVLCGGDLTSSQWVDEEYILELERDAFCSLCGESKTQARIEHFLSTGQKLSN
jgi:3-hydroxyacyl-CoA dehydrogenase